MFGVLGILAVLYWSGLAFTRAPFNGPTFTVRKERLRITIVARGSLESAKNGDIVCTVRARSQGSTVASTIKWLIDNGTEVQKGENVMELDDSGMREQLKQQNIDVDSAKAEEVKAAEDYRSDEIDATSKIEQAENSLALAKIDLEKFIKGDYVQSLKDVEGRIETSRSDLESWKERASWSGRMLKKGLMSKVQVDADESKLEGARIALEKVVEEKRVLVEYTKRRTEQDLQSKVKQAERDLEKTRIQAKAKLAQDTAAHLAKKSIYEQQLAKKREIEQEIAKCVIHAPQDGLVVYYVPEQVMRGGGSQQSIIAQGEPVREGQKLMQIPDLSQMLVNVRVPEAFVSYLHSEYDPDDKSTWQTAQIRIDAKPDRVLKGHVKAVDTVASQADFFASDVKVFKTLVAIDQHMDGLRPGLSAEVTILAYESPEENLVVPIQAVIGTISMGAHRKIFVLNGDGQPELRDIVVGKSNERLVTVLEGLQIGDRVVENPTPLLTDESGMKAGKVRTRNEGDDHGGGPGEDGKKKAGKKKGNGGPPGGNGLPGGPPGGPKAAPAPGAGAPPAKAGFGGPPSDEMKAQFLQKMQSATPAQRRDMLNQIPEQFRGPAREMLRSKGLEVAD